MIKAFAGVKTAVIGMLHAPALPGAPGYGGDWDAIEQRVLGDAEALAAGGVHGLMLENFWDVPFFKDQVEPVTVAAMTRLACAVKAVSDLPLGINMLRNDALSALSVASVVGADYIRVNVLTGAMVSDQGVIEGRAAELMRARDRLGASGTTGATGATGAIGATGATGVTGGKQVKVLADVAVKHAAPLVKRPLGEQVQELIRRAGADGVIVSGTGTGAPTERQDVQAARAAAGGAPVWIGSGVDAQNASAMSALADGLIVGSSLRAGGDLSEGVDVHRVKRLMESLGL